MKLSINEPKAVVILAKKFLNETDIDISKDEEYLLVSFLVKTMYFSASPLGSTNVNCLIRLSKFSYT